MLSVVADTMKLDTNLETKERLSRDANAVQWSADEESFAGFCKRLLIELRRERPREDKESMLVSMLVGLRKAG